MADEHQELVAEIEISWYAQTSGEYGGHLLLKVSANSHINRTVVEMMIECQDVISCSEKCIVPKNNWFYCTFDYQTACSQKDDD